MKLRKCRPIIGLLLVVALSACSRDMYEAGTVVDREMPMAVEAEAVSDAGGSNSFFAQNRFAALSSPAASAGSLLTLASMGQIQPDRHLIKNAVVTLEVDDPENSASTITGAASDAGGYIGELNESTDSLGRRTIAMTVRVPAERFDDVIVNLSVMGKVLHKQITTQDVTEEFVDTDARSRNLKVSEERIVDHLGRVGTLEDILRVENELTRVRQQIEQLDGRLRYLSHRVGFSTLSITLRETPAMESIVPAQTFSVGKTFSEATRSLTGLAQRVLVALVWLGVWSPVWLLAALIALGVRRHYHRRVAA